MNSFSKLLCGNYQNLGELSEILNLLATTVDELSEKCSNYLIQQEPDDIVTFGAYCGRTLLEASCISLIARLTPYRLLLLKRYQEQPSYNLGIRHNISIAWKGDILPKSKPPDQLWNKVDDKDLTSPLLSDYMWEIFWIPAFKSLLDNTISENYKYLKDLANIPPEGISQNLRKEADELYSSLSKGIHQEFIIPHGVAFDAVTVQNLLQRTITFITRLGLISHYIPTSIALINKEEILQCLADIETNEVS